MLAQSFYSRWKYIHGCQPDYSGLPCIALCLADHCLQSQSFRSLQREKRSDVDVPSRAQRHSGRLMEDTRAVRLAAALPELLLRGQTESEHGNLRDGESQGAPGGRGWAEWDSACFPGKWGRTWSKAFTVCRSDPIRLLMVKNQAVNAWSPSKGMGHPAWEWALVHGQLIRNRDGKEQDINYIKILKLSLLKCSYINANAHQAKKSLNPSVLFNTEFYKTWKCVAHSTCN